MKDAQAVLITGTTTGIGRHAALHLARAGHHVIATGRNAAALETLRVEAAGLRLDVVTLDVTDRASLAHAAAEVERLTDGRGVDALVNNAGYGEMAPMLEVREADVRAMYETNVFGLLAVTQAFLPAMVARGKGRIVNITSVGGRVTVPLFGVYNSTKYAVESLSDAMRMELHPLGIRVAIVEPGGIKTEFANTSVRKMDTYRRADSPYAPVYAGIDEVKEKSERIAADPLLISEVIEHAVTARSPRARYVAPFYGRVILALAAWLPTRVFDWLMARTMGLPGRHAPP